MKFMFGLQHPLTCNSSTTFSNPCNKVRGEYFSKEVFLCIPSCILILLASFLHASFIPAFSFLRLYRCVAVDDYITLPQVKKEKKKKERKKGEKRKGLLREIFVFDIACRLILADSLKGEEKRKRNCFLNLIIICLVVAYENCVTF